MEREHTVETVIQGPVAVLRVNGNITSSEASPIPQAIVDATAKGARSLLFRFQPTTYINSAGLALLIGCTVDSQKAGQRVAVCHVSDQLRKVFDIIGLLDALVLFKTEEEAVKALAAHRS